MLQQSKVYALAKEKYFFVVVKFLQTGTEIYCATSAEPTIQRCAAV